MHSDSSEASECGIGDLIAGLNSLHNGEHALLKLVSIGSAAIEPLKEFLFQGKPSNVYEPRRWAVEALARLGAKDALIEYLTWEKDIADPAVRAGEEVVEDAAAREVAKLAGKDVLGLFVNLARTRPLPGIFEALGELQAAGAIPSLIQGLEDDMLRPAAENALRKMAAAARAALLETSIRALPDPNHESPSSLLRRTTALNILADTGISAGGWHRLRPLLEDADPRVFVAASRIAICAEEASEDREKIAMRLVEIVGSADWSLQEDIERLLVDLFADAKHIIEPEIERRRRILVEEPSWDPVFLALLRIKWRAEGDHAYDS